MRLNVSGLQTVGLCTGQMCRVRDLWLSVVSCLSRQHIKHQGEWFDPTSVTLETPWPLHCRMASASHAGQPNTVGEANQQNVKEVAVEEEISCEEIGLKEVTTRKRVKHGPNRVDQQRKDPVEHCSCIDEKRSKLSDTLNRQQEEALLHPKKKLTT